MNKKIVSRNIQLVVAVLDDSEPTAFDFKSLDEALTVANLHKIHGDGDVWWIDEHVTFDDGSVFQDRHYVPDLL